MVFGLTEGELMSTSCSDILPGDQLLRKQAAEQACDLSIHSMAALREGRCFSWEKKRAFMLPFD